MKFKRDTSIDFRRIPAHLQERVAGTAVMHGITNERAFEVVKKELKPSSRKSFFITKNPL